MKCRKAQSKDAIFSLPVVCLFHAGDFLSLLKLKISKPTCNRRQKTKEEKREAFVKVPQTLSH